MSEKWMIASDLHGSAHYCRLLLERFEQERAVRLIFLVTCCTTALETTSRQSMTPKP